MQRLLQHQ